MIGVFYVETVAWHQYQMQFLAEESRERRSGHLGVPGGAKPSFGGWE